MEFVGDKKGRASQALHFAQAKVNIRQPQRSHKVQASGKTKTSKPYTYEHKYAGLTNVNKSVMGAIKEAVDDKNNVQFTCFSDVNNTDQGVDAQTILVDVSGLCVITNKIWFKNFNIGDVQKVASLISYAERYSLSVVFRVANEDDDDVQDVKNTEGPKVLSKQELDSYTTYYNGIKTNLAELYQEAVDGIADAQDQTKGSYTPQDAQAVYQSNQSYKWRGRDKQEALEKAEEEAKREEKLREAQRSEEKPKQEDVSDSFMDIDTLLTEGEYIKQEARTGRRVYSSKIVETDKFLGMPVSSQDLYWHLCMHADDDGFLGNPKTITRSIGTQQDDLKILIEKGYMLVFEDGAIAITNWSVHNYIPKDRHHETVCKEDKKQLELSETKQHRLVTSSPIVQDTESKQDDNNSDAPCIQDDNRVYTEVKLGRVKLSKDNTNKSSSSEDVDPKPKQGSQKIPYERTIDHLNRETSSHHQPTSKVARRLAKTRYNEGFADIDFKVVIDKKRAEWLRNGNMAQYLKPEALSGTKFEAYLNQPDAGPIPRRNSGNKPVRRVTNWDKVQQQQSQTVPQMTQEKRNTIFRKYGR